MVKSSRLLDPSTSVRRNCEMLQCITVGTAAMEGADQEEFEDGINLNISARVILYLNETDRTGDFS